MSNFPNNEQQAELISAAQTIRAQAYAPYSHFLVGSAILAANGQIFTGVNMENASFGLTVCAERHAAAAMVAAGERELTAVVVASSNGVTPCGACRQVLLEFVKEDVPIWLLNTTTQAVRQTTLFALLPDHFEQSQLEG
jgi:cytidine deaminase